MEKTGFTIEELAEASGYAIGTLQNLTHFGALTRPIVGIGEGFGNKGCYLPVVIQELKRYKELKMQGMKKTEIISLMKSERVHVQVLESGRQECLETHREL